MFHAYNLPALSASSHVQSVSVDAGSLAMPFQRSAILQITPLGSSILQGCKLSLAYAYMHRWLPILAQPASNAILCKCAGCFRGGPYPLRCTHCWQGKSATPMCRLSARGGIQSWRSRTPRWAITTGARCPRRPRAASRWTQTSQRPGTSGSGESSLPHKLSPSTSAWIMMQVEALPGLAGA